MELQERELPIERALTGAVSLYREEQISFEVGGRVLAVKDMGLEVRGPAFNEKGELVRQGQPIAYLERTRFSAQVKSSEAQLDAARDDLAAAEAEATLATQNLERQRRVLEQGAGLQQAVDSAQSSFDQAIARAKSRRAAVHAAEEQLQLERENLRDTTLYAPFNGRITAVRTSLGAVVSAGVPIVTLTLMDPVHVRVEVSADDEREIRTGDRALVYPKDPAADGERIPVHAMVFEKSAVADERLRTFQIDLIVRNQRRHIHELLPGLDDLPVINDYMPVIREYHGETGPLFVHVESVLREGDESYVLRLPGVGFNSAGSRTAVGKHVPEKIRVELGDEYTTVTRWNFRSLKEQGSISEGDFVILRPMQSHLNGVAVGRPQWLFRPGSLVPVRFQLESAPRGFYVPVGVITEVAGTPAVYLLENDQAQAHAVTVHEVHGELRRIAGAGITIGAQLIVRGVHYVSDGQPVTVRRTSGER
jgi:RND family efflux transporter MFP subunit